ncbi:MAG: thioredoxin family protein [Deltaproteobacteria bacterium]|nr:thioredoxin family protein [Deltaproteobacteria bacterium]
MSSLSRVKPCSTGSFCPWALGALVLVSTGLLGACEDSEAEARPVSESAPEAPPEPPRVHSRSVDLAPGASSLRDQLAAHVREAQADGLVPVAYTHAEWCPPCQAITRYAEDPSMREAFTGVSIAAIDIDRWGRPELGGLGIGPSVPTWYALGEDGGPAGPSITSSSWGEDVPPNMAPVLESFFEELGVRR